MNTVQKFSKLFLICFIAYAIPIYSDNKISRQITSSQPEDDQIENPALAAELSCSSFNSSNSATIPSTPPTPPEHQRPAINNPGSAITFDHPATLTFTDSTVTLTDDITTRTTTSSDTLIIDGPVTCNQGLAINSGNLVIYGDLTINGTFITAQETSLTVYGNLTANGAIEDLSFVEILSPVIVHGDLSCNDYINSNPEPLEEIFSTVVATINIFAPITADNITINNNIITSDITNNSDNAYLVAGVFIFSSITTNSLTINNNSGTANGEASAAGVAMIAFIKANSICIYNNQGTTADTTNNESTSYGAALFLGLINAETINLNCNVANIANGGEHIGLAIGSIMAANNITMNNNYTAGNGTPDRSAGVYIQNEYPISANTITMSDNSTVTSSDENNIGLFIESAAINTNNFTHTGNSSESINQ